MTRTDGIDRIRQQIRDRRFTFVGYEPDQPFRCSLCGGNGVNCYILEDQGGGQIGLGQTCFKNYFVISPRGANFVISLC